MVSVTGNNKPMARVMITDSRIFNSQPIMTRMAMVMRMMVKTVKMARMLRMMFLEAMRRTMKLNAIATPIAVKVPSIRLFCKS